MGSSNIGDSGRPAAGHKSNFNHTCSLLSHYLKEKGSLGDLNIGFNNMDLQGSTTSKKTMDLLSMLEKSGNLPPREPQPEKSLSTFENSSNLPPEPQKPEKSQLTIFYGGQVLVFDDFPADKLEEIMMLARNGIQPNAKNFTEELSVTPVVPGLDINTVQPNLSTNIIKDLPQTRKNSLARFLKKRKDRISSRASYKTDKKGIVISKPAAKNKAEASNGGSSDCGGGGGVVQFPQHINRHT